MPHRKASVDAATKNSPKRQPAKSRVESAIDDYDPESDAVDVFTAEEISLDRSALLDDGLSIAPEDLGRHALLAAAQQEGLDSDEADSLRLLSESDDPGGNPVSMARRPDIDLTDNVVREGSLFDEPLEDGNLRSPRIKTNEVDASQERDRRAHRAGELATSEHRNSAHRRG